MEPGREDADAVRGMMREILRTEHANGQHSRTVAACSSCNGNVIVGPWASQPSLPMGDDDDDRD